MFFCSKINVQTSGAIEEMVKELVKLPKKNKNKNRVLVITAGPDPAWVAEYNFAEDRLVHCNGYPVQPVNKEDIIDTNGAGDSFAGGFLSQYMKGQSIEDSMIAGHWAAAIIIQKRGFQIPFDLKYTKQSQENESNA